MVKYQREPLDTIFSSLSDPTRREILRRISQDNLTVSEIAKPYAMSLVAVHKHLKVLERASLISRHKTGREVRFSLKAETLKEASRYLAYFRQFWNDQFDSIGKYLAKTFKQEPQNL